MKLIVSFEDRDYTYEIPMEKIIQIMNLDITIPQVENAVREALK